MNSAISNLSNELQSKLFAVIGGPHKLQYDVIFNNSFLFSQLRQELAQPFIRVELNKSSYSINLIDEKGQVVNSFECSYDDLEFLECLVTGEIPSCVLDLLLNSAAPKLLWNGIIFAELCTEGTEEKFTTVLKFTREVLMVYLKSLKTAETKCASKFVLDPTDVDVQFEKELLVSLNPELDLDVKKDPISANQVDEVKSSSVVKVRPDWRKLLTSRVKTKQLHSINQLRVFKPSRSALFLRNHPRSRPRKSFKDLPMVKPVHSADILEKKKGQYDSFYKAKKANPESEIDYEKVIGQNLLINPTANSSFIVPEEKHTIEAFGSSHCAEITISRRIPDNFFVGELRVIQRTNQNRSNISNPGAGAINLPFLNEKCCRFELGSRATVNRYLFEYVRMISERDRTPKHTVTNLRKNHATI